MVNSCNIIRGRIAATIRSFMCDVPRRFFEELQLLDYRELRAKEDEILVDFRGSTSRS
jgi:hypothetical protein